MGSSFTVYFLREEVKLFYFSGKIITADEKLLLTDEEFD
jgi:hypothetical protein